MTRARFLAHPVALIVIGIAVVMASIFVTLATVESLVPRLLRVGWPVPLAALTRMLGYRLFFSHVEKRTITELALAVACSRCRSRATRRAAGCK